jgi:hypothetical protein
MAVAVRAPYMLAMLDRDDVGPDAPSERSRVAVPAEHFTGRSRAIATAGASIAARG